MREYLGTLAALVVGGVLLLVSYGATWAVVVIPVFAGGGETGPVSEVSLPGRELVPLGGAAGWVALAGVAGILATRTWGRRVIGAVVAIVGGAVGATALAFGLTRSAFIQEALGARGLGTEGQVSTTAWWWAALVGGLVVAVGGLLVLLRGPSWPRLSRRYERTSSAAAGVAVEPIPGAEGPIVGGIAAWDALDRGEDPTDPATRAG